MAVNVGRSAAHTEREAWQKTFDRLAQWKENPDMVGDEAEGIPSPEVSTIELAIQLAHMLQKLEYKAPNGPSVDGEGGVTLEWFDGTWHRSIEIQADHRIEEWVFDNAELLSTRVILDPADAGSGSHG